MSFTDIENFEQYNTDGIVVVFSFPHPYQRTSDIRVELSDSVNAVPVTLVEGVDYSVSAPADAGGTITTLTTLAAGQVITILRELPANQIETDFNEGGEFQQEVVEDGLDRQGMIAQQILNRALQIIRTSDLTGPIDVPVVASSLLGWDASGENLKTYTVTTVQDPNFDSIQNYGNDLATAVAAIGVSSTILVVDVPNTVTANLTVPSNIELMYIGAGVTTVTAGKLLTIGAMRDTSKQCFVAAFGDVKFSRGQFVKPEWWGGVPDDSTDNEAAFKSAMHSFTTAGGLILCSKGIYRLTELVFEEKVSLHGSGRLGGTDIRITGDGGGAPSVGSNGGIQIFHNGCDLVDLGITYTNASLECLINYSKIGGTGASEWRNLEIVGAGGAGTYNALGIYLAALVNFSWNGGYIGNMKQDMKIASWFNGCHINGVTFRPGDADYANGVFHRINYLIEIAGGGSTLGSSINGCTFEQGPNGIKLSGKGTISINKCYMSDGASGDMWAPSTAVSLGDFIIPSAVVTGDTTAASADITNVSSTAALYVGQRLKVIGAGVAGATLDTRIAAISGTTVTMFDNASTNTVGTDVFYPAYAGWGYLVSVAGTTGAAPPAFPTTVGATVADGTATLMNYDTCAWINNSPPAGEQGKDNVSLTKNYFAFNMVGVCGIRIAGGGVPNIINASGNDWLNLGLVGYLDGVNISVKGDKLDGYQTHGFAMRGTVAAQTQNYFENLVYLGAKSVRNDVVIENPNAASVGGLVVGSATTVRGVGSTADQIMQIKNDVDVPTYAVTNPVTRRTFDTTTITLAQLAEVVGTMIADDQARGFKK